MAECNRSPITILPVWKRSEHIPITSSWKLLALGGLFIAGGCIWYNSGNISFFCICKTSKQYAIFSWLVRKVNFKIANKWGITSFINDSERCMLVDSTCICFKVINQLPDPRKSIIRKCLPYCVRIMKSNVSHQSFVPFQTKISSIDLGWR